MIRIVMILFFTCACFIMQAQVNIITTIAGTDSFGYSGDNGAATNAKLKAPEGVCLDKLGNIYIADAGNNRIRKIDITTGIITTIAGNGTAGYLGDNDVAINAELWAPEAFCIDSAGDMYIADALNHRIRKITVATGIITTIAGTGVAGDIGDGNPATDAELNGPSSVCVDKYGNIYIADYYNNKIRKINSTTGIISTIVGSGAQGYFGDGALAINAALYGPLEVVTDSVGNIFISDQWNNVVRRVDATTGIITTIAGNGTLGYSGDNSDATDAHLSQPAGLFIDKDNNIFIADYGNGSIRKITGSGITSSGEVTGVITTVAGKGVTGFFGDGGPATNAKLFCSDVCFDTYGNMIIADYENNRIRKVNNALAVNQFNKTNELALFPNPTKGKFIVQTTSGNAEIFISTIAGEKVYRITSHSKETPVDISNQPPGVYMVYVQCDEGRFVSKVVVE